MAEIAAQEFDNLAVAEADEAPAEEQAPTTETGKPARSVVPLGLSAAAVCRGMENPVHSTRFWAKEANTRTQALMDMITLPDIAPNPSFSRAKE